MKVFSQRMMYYNKNRQYRIRILYVQVQFLYVIFSCVGIIKYKIQCEFCTVTSINNSESQALIIRTVRFL